MSALDDGVRRRRSLHVIALIAALASLSACRSEGGARDADAAAATAERDGNAVAQTSGPEVIRRSRLLESFAELELGAEPYRYRAIVERVNGRIDTLAVVVRSLQDTSVARIVDGAVTAVAVGQTPLQVEISPGLVVRGVVSVSERVFADSVWLARGQMRAWDLRPGWYRITVDAKAAPGQPQPLELAADLICVPDSRGPRETIACRVRQNTRVLLRHTGAGTTPGPALAVVTILRTPR